jgi:hypothetical protein
MTNGVGLIALAALVALAGCAAPAAKPFAASSALPAANAVAGWTPTDAAQAYTHDNLYNLVDGQAESFFAYNFQQAVVGRYQNAARALINVEIWQLASPADAFGLYTSGRTGKPVALGNDGSADAGQRVLFWQDDYYVAVSSVRGATDADLQAFAKVLADALPKGGTRPAVVDRLPPGGLVAQSYIFFRQELSVGSEVWLGGENRLGLGQDTDGVVARYMLGGQVTHLLLVQYPSATRAEAGLAALKSGQIEAVVAARANQNLLGAVIGQADASAADTLLAEALR